MKSTYLIISLFFIWHISAVKVESQVINIGEIEFKPGLVILFIIMVILIEIFLHTYGMNLFG